MSELLYHFDANGLLQGPNVVHRLLPESGRQGRQSNHIAIVHTMVGYLQSTDNYFRRSDVGTESTFGVGGKYDGALDGVIYQWLRVWEVAEANYQANPYAMSIETSDGGGLRYKEIWSPKQAESVAQILAAWCIHYDRPARLVNRAKGTERGFGYHRQGVNPYRRSDDDVWSTVYAKECPGFERSAHFVQHVIPRVQYILNPPPPPTPPPAPPIPEEDIMAELEEVLHGFFTHPDFKELLTNTRETLDLQGQILQVLDSEFVSVDDKLRRIRNLVLANTSQPNWGEVSDRTWDQVRQNRWGRLIPSIS